LDLWNEAAFGWPRLFGWWHAAGLAVWWLAIVPLPFVWWAARSKKPAIFVPLGCLVAWAIVSLGLIATDIVLRQIRHTLPPPALIYLPFMSTDRFPWGSPTFIEDSLVGHRHRAGNMVTTPDYLRDGDLIGGNLTELAPNIPSATPVRVTREFGANGFAAEFGRYEDDPTREPEVIFVGDSFVVGYNIPPGDISVAHAMAALRTGGFWAENDWPATATERDLWQRGAMYACANYTPTEGFATFLRAWAHPRDRVIKPPRVVVAMLYGGNDFTDADMHTHYMKSGQTAMTVPRLAAEFDPPGWLESSPFLALTTHLWHPTDRRFPTSQRGLLFLERAPMSADYIARIMADKRFEMATPPVPGTYRPVAPPLRPRKFRAPGMADQAISPFELADLVAGENWPVFRPGWGHLLRGFDQMAMFQTRTGTPVVVVYAPSKLHVFWPLLADGELSGPEILAFTHRTVGQEVKDRLTADGGTFLPLLTERADNAARCIEEQATARGLRFLNLTEALRAAAETTTEPIYLPYDTHWAPAGHKAAGEAIARAILAR